MQNQNNTHQNAPPTEKRCLEVGNCSSAVTEPELLQIAIFFETKHDLDNFGSPEVRQDHQLVMQLETSLVSRVKEALRDPLLRISNQVLVAVAMCAAYEIKHGTRGSYHVHMSGLVQMIDLRGGLHEIWELDGGLARLLLWIDEGASRMARSTRYLENADMVDTTCQSQAHTKIVGLHPRLEDVSLDPGDDFKLQPMELFNIMETARSSS